MDLGYYTAEQLTNKKRDVVVGEPVKRRDILENFTKKRLLEIA